jgi:putative membrane protein
MNNEQLRDELALERTRLANERTLLAYVRTSLALAGGGAAVLHFFADRGWVAVVGALLLFGGVAVGVVGLQRFLAVRRRINSVRIGDTL